jgi:hypothetical protein
MRSSQSKCGAGKEAAENMVETCEDAEKLPQSRKASTKEMDAFTGDGAGLGPDPAHAWYAETAEPRVRCAKQVSQGGAGDRPRTVPGFDAVQGFGADVPANGTLTTAILEGISADAAVIGAPKGAKTLTGAKVETSAADVAAGGALNTAKPLTRAKLEASGGVAGASGALNTGKLGNSIAELVRCYKQGMGAQAGRRAVEEEMRGRFGLHDLETPKHPGWFQPGGQLNQELRRILGVVDTP